MGPPRRTPNSISHSNPSQSLDPMSSPHRPQTVNSNAQYQFSTSSSTATIPGIPAPHLAHGMSASSKYDHNLKVLRRRDPSIISIFDQFTHVCVYHHNGAKWEKLGYEGTMFLYERNAYPPYGFYILNRAGMEDHIQRLYPEDDITSADSYLIIRSYPEYTNQRMTEIHSSCSASSPPVNKFSEIYSRPGNLNLKTKEASNIIGLWYFANAENREPMIDVMKRIHQYIKQNRPYPDEYRYGPGKPPPPNTNLPVSQSNPSTYRSVDAQRQSGQSDSESSANESFQYNNRSRHLRNGSHPDNDNISELDKLFAKLRPTPVISKAEPSSTTQPSGEPTVASILAQLQGEIVPSPAPIPTLTTGLSLLDSIFASATISPPLARAQANPPTYRPLTSLPSSHRSLNVSNNKNIPSPAASTPIKGAPALYHQSLGISPASTISSFYVNKGPTPEESAQILDQDVISSLLGLPPSRAPSVASRPSRTSRTPSVVSHHSSREGDNERDTTDSDEHSHSFDSDGGYSESSTVLDPDAENDLMLQAAGASAGFPIIASTSPNGNVNTRDSRARKANKGAKRSGDVTPRALYGELNGIAPAVESSGSLNTIHSTPTRNGTLKPSIGSTKPKVPNGVNGADKTTSLVNGSDTKSRRLVPFEADSELWPYPRSTADESHDIVELDFEDTSALSDMDQFRRAMNARKPDTRSKGKKKEKWKERNAREREEIEQSWDVPQPSPAYSTYNRPYSDGLSDEIPSPASPSPCPSPKRLHTPPVRVQSMEAVAPSQIRPVLNGTTSKENITKAANGKKSLLDADAVRESVADVVHASRRIAGGLERPAFVGELMALIYTDQSFVDALYQDYSARI